ncbi:MAG: putative peptidase [Prokaryotic dsDNA virus sp.]|nr:MAG: putative peptidase [Prokaryotic dsDNA virus sp.]|tara:strand:- start:323 stop:1615 length:1293 start_codon:yes stop_codon:yes gene_type:complete
MSSAAIMRSINPVRHDPFSILKSDDLVIGGYASIEMVDKQNDLITLDALDEAVGKYMEITKFRNVMTNHSNVQVGEVIPQYRDKSGKLWKTEVDDVGFFVVIKMREDIEKAKEVGREIRDGTLRSFSIGGQALEKKKKSHKEYGDYNEISKLELHEVTICEKGINPEAKFDILKMEKGEKDMTEIEKALNALNELLEKNNDSELNKEEDISSNSIELEESFNKNLNKNQESSNEANNMTEEVVKEEEELMDTATEEEVPSEEEKMMEYQDAEVKAKPSLDAGEIEGGGAGETPSSEHDQLDSDFMAKFDNQSTLDLSPENLEKAYAEFKAEQLEKAAYDAIKDNFQARFDSEMVAKQDEIEKANYDAKAEVAELRKQFTDLLSTLNENKEEVIRKQEEAVSELNLPDSDEIAKMDWNDINALVERLEAQL